VTGRLPPRAARSLTAREWETLMRERSFLRPLPPPTPLHRMGRARLDYQQDDDNPSPKERT
jgi:hypothetical protein